MREGGLEKEKVEKVEGGSGVEKVEGGLAGEG